MEKQDSMNAGMVELLEEGDTARATALRNLKTGGSR